MKFLEESYPFDLARNRSVIDLGWIPFGKNFGHVIELNTLSPPMEYVGSVVIRAPARSPTYGSPNTTSTEAQAAIAHCDSSLSLKPPLSSR